MTTPKRTASPKTKEKPRVRRPASPASPEGDPKERLLAALEETLGIALFACRRAEIEYDDYRAWLRDDPEFARRVDLIDEIALDFVEGKALDEIKNGNARLIQFYLQTKGKARGYDPTASNAPRQTVAFLSPEEMEY